MASKRGYFPNNVAMKDLTPSSCDPQLVTPNSRELLTPDPVTPDPEPLYSAATEGRPASAMASSDSS